jgi:hypothetical protein
MRMIACHNIDYAIIFQDTLPEVMVGVVFPHQDIAPTSGGGGNG